MKPFSYEHTWKLSITVRSIKNNSSDNGAQQMSRYKVQLPSLLPYILQVSLGNVSLPSVNIHVDNKVEIKMLKSAIRFTIRMFKKI